MRILALLLLLAVLPTVELAEQVIHAAEHALHDEVADHGAHHDEPADEHGCTGLVHLCGLHAQVTVGATMSVATTIEVRGSLPVDVPLSLHDQRSLEPAHRPPIV